MPYLDGHHNPAQNRSCPTCGCPLTPNGETACRNCGGSLNIPFVAVFDVGQGSCTGIVGADGKIHALFDYGVATVKARRPSPKTQPCLCDDPLIVLSHWDEDHYQLATVNMEALSSQWLGPQQGGSSVATAFRKLIKNAGGQVHLWPRTQLPKTRPQRKFRHQHMLFPWGWLERCTGLPNADNQVNSSGLAAYICVQDPWASGARRRRVDANNQPDASARLPAAQRASDAAADVVNHLGGVAGNLARIRALAEPVAAALAGSQVAAVQASLPFTECASAAVAAAAELLNNGPVRLNIVNALAAEFVVFGLARPGDLARVKGELADATLRAARRRGRRARGRAAASQFTWAPSVDVATRKQLLKSSVAAPPPPLTVSLGYAPFARGSKFTLLNGDANFSVLPSMVRKSKRPSIVAMTAMHHGAIFEDGSPLALGAIPFAPGSRAARAVLRCRAAKVRGSMIGAVVEAGLALSHRRSKGLRRSLRVQVSRAARAAALAILVTHRGYPGEASYPQLANAAAAAAVAALRGLDSPTTGLAAALACYAQRVGEDTKTSPIEHNIELAKLLIEARRPPVRRLSWDTVRAAANGSILAQVIDLAPRMADAVLQGGHVNLSPHDAGQDAATAHQYLSQNTAAAIANYDAACKRRSSNWKKPKTAAATRRVNLEKRLCLRPNNVGSPHQHGPLNDVVTLAVDCVLRSRRTKEHPDSHARLVRAAWTTLNTGAGTNLGTLATSLQNTLQLGWAVAPGGVQGIAHMAARMAAERIAAYHIGVSQCQITAVLAAAHDRRRRAQAYHAFGRRRDRGAGGMIAYSYGVHTSDFSHQYESEIGGDMGHPHPLAILKYEAHGWKRRYNASARSKHKGTQGAPANPRGHTGLGWNAQAQRSHAEQAFNHRCAKCGKQTVFNG